MKKILITGANSYIGTSFEGYINDKYAGEYQIDTIDMLDQGWREKSFSGYDAVFHVAGIAHSDSGKISEEMAKRYYSVNTDLTIEVAKKAKGDKVGQLIFMSSAIVYGGSSKIGKERRIGRETQPSPENAYGDSKLQAENGILPLSDESFKVCVLRPPMIYGRGCKGNYQALSSFAKKMKFFPYVRNMRSMLYIESLCEFVRLMIENEESGIFFPQNSEYSNTSDMVKMIGQANGRTVHLVKGFAWALKLISPFTSAVNKAFGSLSYEMEMSEYKQNYRVAGLEESIKITEKGKENAC